MTSHGGVRSRASSGCEWTAWLGVVVASFIAGQVDGGAETATEPDCEGAVTWKILERRRWGREMASEPDCEGAVTRNHWNVLKKELPISRAHPYKAENTLLFQGVLGSILAAHFLTEEFWLHCDFMNSESGGPISPAGLSSTCGGTLNSSWGSPGPRSSQHGGRPLSRGQTSPQCQAQTRVADGRSRTHFSEAEKSLPFEPAVC